VFYDINNKDVFGIFPMIMRPKSKGFIRLKSKNPKDYPLMYHNYLTHPDDIKVLVEGVKAAVAVGETQTMRRFGARFHRKAVQNCEKVPLYTDAYWECALRQYTMSIYHYAGTCKMGPPSDADAVVDARLRVYGVPGLRVIDHHAHHHHRQHQRACGDDRREGFGHDQRRLGNRPQRDSVASLIARTARTILASFNLCNTRCSHILSLSLYLFETGVLLSMTSFVAKCIFIVSFRFSQLFLFCARMSILGSKVLVKWFSGVKTF
jgi:GMC oxidoreductase